MAACVLVPLTQHAHTHERVLASPSHDTLQCSSPKRDYTHPQFSTATLDPAPASCVSVACTHGEKDSRSLADRMNATKMSRRRRTHMPRTADPKVEPLATAAPGSEGSSRRYHMPKCPRGERHMLSNLLEQANLRQFFTYACLQTIPVQYTARYRTAQSTCALSIPMAGGTQWMRRSLQSG